MRLQLFRTTGPRLNIRRRQAPSRTSTYQPSRSIDGIAPASYGIAGVFFNASSGPRLEKRLPRGHSPSAIRLYGPPTAFHHSYLVATFVVFYMVHKCLNQQQTAAADPFKIGRVRRIGQQFGIESFPFIAYNEDDLLRGQRDTNVDAPLAPGRLGSSLGRQPIVFLLIRLA